MHRYAVGFMAGAALLAGFETAFITRALHRALTDDDSVNEDEE